MVIFFFLNPNQVLGWFESLTEKREKRSVVCTWDRLVLSVVWVASSETRMCVTVKKCRRRTFQEGTRRVSWENHCVGTKKESFPGEAYLYNV